MSETKRRALTRREFAMAGVASAAIACLGGAVAFGTEERSAQMRPPGALDETSFEARCNRCQRCAQACPRNVVQPLALSAGLSSLSTPTLVFRNDYCDFCMKCAEVCPTGALDLNTPSATRIGTAKVISDACVAWNWTGCTVCEEACPVEGALRTDKHGRPQVDEALCTGCGLCEAVCPASSLRSYDASVVGRGIYVVPLSSEAANVPGPLTSTEFAELRFVMRGKENSDKGSNAGAGKTSEGNAEKGGSR